MYPLHCTGGYAMPIKDGKFEICAIGFKTATHGTANELSLWDTGVNTVIDEDNPPNDAQRIFHMFGKDDSTDFYSLPEPLKVRRGLSIGAISNIDPGQIYVYVR